MTKLNVGKLFEVGILGKNAEPLMPFFDYFNSCQDNFIRILRNGIGLRDNIDSEIRTLGLRDAVPVNISVTKRPLVILIGQQTEFLNPVVSLSWDMNADGTVRLQIKRQTSSSTEITVLLIIIYS